MKGYVAQITFRQKTRFWDNVIFTVLTIKGVTAKTNAWHYDIDIKVYVLPSACHCTGTFHHSYAYLRCLFFNKNAFLWK